MIEEIRNIEISTIRNDGSIDIFFDEFHFSGRVYTRSLNLDKAMVRHLINRILTEEPFNKEFVEEYKNIFKESV